MRNKLYILQNLILFIGTIFAFFTVYTDFARFYQMYGSLTRISDCVIPNPVTTPCFYGAFAFLISFIWSMKIYKNRDRDNTSQGKLQYLLIASTLFAWTNLAIEIYKFYNIENTNKISCSGVPTESIFTTACFIGSTIFLLALLNSIILTKLNKKN